MYQALHVDRLKPIIARQQNREKAASGPLEDKWRATSRLDVFRAYNLDLALVLLVTFAAAIAAVIVVSGLLKTVGSAGQGLQIIFGATIFGTILEVLRRTYETAVKRLATIDLFSIEMLSIMRVFAAANIIGDFVCLYDKATPSGGPNQSAADGTKPKPSPIGFADSARKENYFSIFDKNSTELGGVDPAIVNDVTAFYTFLRASRDATGALQLWKEPSYDVERMKADVIAIIYLCFLMSVHGLRALDVLITSKNNKYIANDIVAGVQLQCFAFLDYVLPDEDFRRERLDQRRTDCRKLQQEYGYLFGPGPA
jgi:hypothetical protein